MDSSRRAEDGEAPRSKRRGPSLLESALDGVRPLRDRDKLAAPPAAARRARRAAVAAPPEPRQAGAAIIDGDVPGEGFVRGFDRARLRRLRAGEIRPDASVDLHGLGSAAARRTLERSVLEAFERGARCLLVVHGSGSRSTQGAVLKGGVPRWLREPPCAPQLLAFTPARPRDGGAGATYVLLRRRRTAAS